MTTKRLANFEALRTIAMLLIVLWHFFRYNPEFFFSENLTWPNLLMEDALLLLGGMGVNLFVLISGYFLVDKQFNYRRIINIWLQVFFYSVLFSAIGWIYRKEFLTIHSALDAFLPLLSKRYWFVGPYLGIVLLAPFLSYTVKALSQKQYQWLLLVLVLLCCTFTLNFPYGNNLGAGSGYSLIWFIVLFFFGGYLNRFDPFPSKKKLSWIFLLVALGVYLFYIGKALWHYTKGLGHHPPEFSAYNSFVFPLSVLFFLIFKKTSPEGGWLLKGLAALAPYTFGVYLIHEHPLVRQVVWCDWWPSLGISYDDPWMIPAAIGFSICIFLLCAGMDFFRQVFIKLIKRFKPSELTPRP